METKSHVMEVFSNDGQYGTIVIPTIHTPSAKV